MKTKLEKTAAAWVIREQEGLTEREIGELKQWCVRNPDADAALQRARQAWARFDGMEGSDAFDDLLEPEPGNGFAFLRWGSIAALFLLSTMGVIWAIWSFDGTPKGLVQPVPTVASWEAGDWIELDDQSTIELNTGAVVEYLLMDSSRSVWVLSGEAYFTVAADPDRPFVVYAGSTRTEAVGTEFNVKMGTQSVEVLVTEGKVRFSVGTGMVSAQAEPDPRTEEAYLPENHRAVVADPEAGAGGIVIREVSESELRHTMAWKPVTLRFESAPLREVVAQFNRYNSMQLVIADPAIADIRIVAKFRSNNLQSFLRLLEVTSDISALREGERIHLFAATVR